MRDRYSPTHRVRAEEVDDPISFAMYAQQTLGVPWPTLKDETILRKRIKDLFGQYPGANYQTLIRVVEFCRVRRRRRSRVWLVVDEYRNAWEAGELPELQLTTEDVALEGRITRALGVENDPDWRRRLVGSRGRGRKETYDQWHKSRGQLLST